jgi:hypothetical protein
VITTFYINEQSIYIGVSEKVFVIGWAVNTFGDYYVYCNRIALVHESHKYNQVCYLEECGDWRNAALYLLPEEIKPRLKNIIF